MRQWWSIPAESTLALSCQNDYHMSIDSSFGLGGVIIVAISKLQYKQ